MKPFFFIDYDNTIFSHRTQSIPTSALTAMKALQADGFRVVIASGRAFRSGAFPEGFGPDFVPDCLVSSNGALIEAEGTLIWEQYFQPELQKRIMDYVLEKGYCLMSSWEGRWRASNTHPFPPSPSFRSTSQAKLESGAAFQELYSIPLPSFFVADTKAAIDDLQAQFPETKLLYMGDELGGADIIPRENGKVMGAARLLNYYHVSWADTVAIGDSMNDADLIRQAAFGVAMGNSMPEVQEIADYVAKDIDADGLADAIAQARAWYAARA